MHKVIDIEMGTNILEVNRHISKKNLELFKENNVIAIDVMGSIGSGKTLLIEKIIEILKVKGIKSAAIAGDVSGMDDYLRYKSHDIPVVNVNTGKECHLEGHSIQHALEDLDLTQIDILFIENVGNLVCPADFPLGTNKRIVVISVTEGDDMVRKHPTIFGMSDIIVINKIDLSEIIEVDPQIIINDAEKIAPHTKIVLTDAKHGKGLEELIDNLGL